MKTRARLAQLLHGSPDCIVRYDALLRHRYANPRFEDLCGLTPQQYLGRKPSELPRIGAANARALEDKLRAALQTGQPQEIEIEWRAADGRILWHGVRIVAEADAQGRATGLLSMATDITQRKRIEEAWEFVTHQGWGDDGEAFFPSLVNYLARALEVDYVFVDRLDEAEPGMAETVALHAKGGLVANMRYALKDTPCETVAKRIPCCYASDVQARFPRDAMLAQMGVHSYAGVPLLDAAGQAVGLIVAMDRRPMAAPATVTSVLRVVAGRAAAELVRERSDHALQAREREFRLLAESCPDYIVRYDAERRVRYANPAMTARLRRELPQLIGLRPIQILPHQAAEMERHEQVLQRVLDTGEAAECELTLTGPAGEAEVHHVRYAAIRAPDGQIAGVLTIGRDITERLAAERTIQALHKHREVAAEEERRHVARELHDEMGQMLSALRLQISLLRMRWGASDAELREKVDGLQGMVDEVIHVVRNLVSSLRPAVLDLGIASALEWLIEEFGRSSGAACQLHVDEGASLLDGEQTAMVFRIAQESLTNVVRHAAATRVHVRLERCLDDCVLTVADNGRGFEPTARPRGSLGHVGVQERARMLGGDVEIRSRPGNGAMVRVTFPVRSPRDAQ